MEHADNEKIIVGKEIQRMDRSALERELRDLNGLPTSRALLDVGERLVRVREKSGFHHNRVKPPRRKNKATQC